jgi:diguanylate cyclase (GGDEF)-like protein
MSPRLSSKQVIIAGFAGVALLLAGLVVVGLTRLGEINAQMDEIANRTFKRAEAVFTMRMVARDRLIGLQSMFFLTDPFDRDAEKMRYSAQAVRFIQARDTLFALGLTPDEQAIWQKVRPLIARDENLHQQALDLIFADRLPEAGLLIREEIIPLENQLLDALQGMLDIERAGTTQKLEYASLRYRETFALMVLLSLGTLAATVGTAVYVTRKSAQNERLLVQEKHRAEEAAEKLAWAASHDPLTGLPNRRVFERKLGLLLDAAREEGGNHVLVYIDLDRFKLVNDTCGHEAGDQLLMTVTRLMRDAIRAGDTLARLGGDEFGLLLPHCAVPVAEALVRRIQHTVESFSLAWGHHSLNVGLSAGIVPVDTAVADVAELVHRADMACYESKEARRQSTEHSAT